jgi:hypothetical protein
MSPRATINSLQSCAYLAGACARFGASAFEDVVTETVPLLQSVVASEGPLNSVIENAAAAILYIAVYADGLVSLDDALDVVMPILPFHVDKDESMEVCQELCKLIDTDSPALRVPERLSRVLVALACTVAPDDEDDDEDEDDDDAFDAIVATVQSARERLGKDVDGALALMSDRERESFAEAFEM